MKRKCFLCDVNTEIIISNEWDLPGLVSCEIGYSICPKCGLIMQSPACDINSMNKYYADVANYINPGRKGKPSLDKIKDVKRLINLVIEYIYPPPRAQPFKWGVLMAIHFMNFNKQA